ncbi:hypothetical protein JL720_16564 [Aureococcus anophagefferens]|nr:hypothetical protein JL720_16564 [Aureococcus anophagefferens]
MDAGDRATFADAVQAEVIVAKGDSRHAAVAIAPDGAAAKAGAHLVAVGPRRAPPPAALRRLRASHQRVAAVAVVAAVARDADPAHLARRRRAAAPRRGARGRDRATANWFREDPPEVKKKLSVSLEPSKIRALVEQVERAWDEADALDSLTLEAPRVEVAVEVPTLDNGTSAVPTAVIALAPFDVALRRGAPSSCDPLTLTAFDREGRVAPALLDQALRRRLTLRSAMDESTFLGALLGPDHSLDVGDPNAPRPRKQQNRTRAPDRDDDANYDAVTAVVDTDGPNDVLGKVLSWTDGEFDGYWNAAVYGYALEDVAEGSAQDEHRDLEGGFYVYDGLEASVLVSANAYAVAYAPSEYRTLLLALRVERDDQTDVERRSHHAYGFTLNEDAAFPFNFMGEVASTNGPGVDYGFSLAAYDDGEGVFSLGGNFVGQVGEEGYADDVTMSASLWETETAFYTNGNLMMDFERGWDMSGDLSANDDGEETLGLSGYASIHVMEDDEPEVTEDGWDQKVDLWSYFNGYVGEDGHEDVELNLSLGENVETWDATVALTVDTDEDWNFVYGVYVNDDGAPDVAFGGNFNVRAFQSGYDDFTLDFAFSEDVADLQVSASLAANEDPGYSECESCRAVVEPHGAVSVGNATGPFADASALRDAGGSLPTEDASFKLYASLALEYGAEAALGAEGFGLSGQWIEDAAGPVDVSWLLSGHEPDERRRLDLSAYYQADWDDEHHAFATAESIGGFSRSAGTCKNWGLDDADASTLESATWTNAPTRAWTRGRTVHRADHAEIGVYLDDYDDYDDYPFGDDTVFLDFGTSGSVRRDDSVELEWSSTCVVDDDERFDVGLEAYVAWGDGATCEADAVFRAWDEPDVDAALVHGCMHGSDNKGIEGDAELRFYTKSHLADLDPDDARLALHATGGLDWEQTEATDDLSTLEAWSFFAVDGEPKWYHAATAAGTADKTYQGRVDTLLVVDGETVVDGGVAGGVEKHACDGCVVKAAAHDLSDHDVFAGFWVTEDVYDGAATLVGGVEAYGDGEVDGGVAAGALGLAVLGAGGDALVNGSVSGALDWDHRNAKDILAELAVTDEDGAELFYLGFEGVGSAEDGLRVGEAGYPDVVAALALAEGGDELASFAFDVDYDEDPATRRMAVGWGGHLDLDGATVFQSRVKIRKDGRLDGGPGEVTCLNGAMHMSGAGMMDRDSMYMDMDGSIAIDNLERGALAAFEDGAIVATSLDAAMRAYKGGETKNKMTYDAADNADHACDATLDVESTMYMAAAEKAVPMSWDDDGYLELFAAHGRAHRTADDDPFPTRRGGWSDWGACYDDGDAYCACLEDESKVYQYIECDGDAVVALAGLCTCEDLSCCDWYNPDPGCATAYNGAAWQPWWHDYGIYSGKFTCAGGTPYVTWYSGDTCDDYGDDDVVWHSAWAQGFSYADFDPSKDCALVAKNPDGRCDKTNGDGVEGWDACPVSCGTCDATPAPTSWCQDSGSWHMAGSPHKDCDYVMKNPDSRCKKKDDHDVKAKHACHASCDTCDLLEDEDEDEDDDPDCQDSTTWYRNHPSKDCDHVAKSPDTRCAKDNDDGVFASVACPKACGTCDETPAPTGSCQDSGSWYMAGSPHKDCDYVMKNMDSRCKKKDDHDVKAKHACPVSCDTCDLVEDEDEDEDEDDGHDHGDDPDCQDSTTWYRNHPSKDCDHVAKNPDTRCAKDNDDGVLASVACPAACDMCDATPAPTSSCRDSGSWYMAGSPHKDCDYVMKNPDSRCKKKDDHGVKAKHACLATCEEC